MAGQVWEYATDSFQCGPGAGVGMDPTSKQRLAAYGSDGWEIVDTVRLEGGGNWVTIIFKRLPVRAARVY